MARDEKIDVATTAPLSSYDYFTPETIKAIEQAIRSVVGAKSEMMLIDHSTMRSVFTYSSTGLICNLCGTLQGHEDPIACQECGAAFTIALVIGFK